MFKRNQHAITQRTSFNIKLATIKEKLNFLRTSAIRRIKIEKLKKTVQYFKQNFISVKEYYINHINYQHLITFKIHPH